MGLKYSQILVCARMGKQMAEKALKLNQHRWPFIGFEGIVALERIGVTESSADFESAQAVIRGEFEKRMCVCRNCLTHKNHALIKCETCGMMYCDVCAVDPEFYGGEDCPFCADKRDKRGPDLEEVQCKTMIRKS
jgi:hypothetical protein